VKRGKQLGQREGGREGERDGRMDGWIVLFKDVTQLAITLTNVFVWDIFEEL
jgi:hypothetical protein